MATRSSIVDILLRLQSQGQQNVKRDLGQVRQRAEQVNEAMRTMTSIGRSVAAVAGFAVMARQIKQTVQAGLEWNRTLQDTRDAMTAMLVSADPLMRGDMDRAFASAGVQMRQLREGAERTGLSLDVLFELFSETAPLAANAGISMKQYADLTLDAAQASNALGIETQNVVQGLRQLLTGTVSSEGVLSNVLGLTTEGVQQAMEQGRLYEMLSERLSTYVIEVEGLTAEQNRLRNVWRELAATISEPVFEQIEDSVRATRQALSDEELQAELRTVGELFADMFQALRAGTVFIAEHRKGLLLVVGTYATWRASLVASRLAMALYTKAVQASTTAIAANAVATRVHPVGLIATALAAGAVAWQQYRLRIAEANAEMREARRDAQEFSDTLKSIASEAERRAVLGPMQKEFAEVKAEYQAASEALGALRQEIRDVDQELRDTDDPQLGWQLYGRRAELLERERTLLAEFPELADQRATLEARIRDLQSDQVDQQIDQGKIDRRRKTLLEELEAGQQRVKERLEEIERSRMTEVQLLTDLDRRVEEIRESERERLELLEDIEDEEERARAIKLLQEETALELRELEEEREEVQERIRDRIQEEADERERLLRLARQMQDAEAALAASRARQARTAAEGDPFAFADDRRDTLMRAIEEQNAALDRQIGLVRERAIKLARSDDPQDQIRRVQLEERLVQLEQERITNAHELGRLQRELAVSLVDWSNQFGTTIQQVAGMITGTLDGAVRGIAEGIEGLINGTMTWSQAWDNLVQSVLRSMVRMVAEFIAQQLVMMAVRRTMAATEMAAVQTQATAAAIQWAPAATAASIASFGAAAGAGTAAMIAAMATGQTAAAGMSAAGFRPGGYTGPGNPGDVAGWVHRKEFVFSAPATEALGVDYLSELHSMAREGRGFQSGGAAPGAPASGSGRSGGRDGATRIALISDLRNEMREAVENGFEVYDRRRRARGEEVPR